MEIIHYIIKHKTSSTRTKTKNKKNIHPTPSPQHLFTIISLALQFAIL